MNNKVWIDLENSPHVLFFRPIIAALERRGYPVVVTARDYAQVLALADLFGIEYRKIGAHFGRNKIMKVIGLFSRSLSLLPFILAERPTLSFSHGSRTQMFSSKICNIPCIIAGDYEYGQRIPFIKADMYLVPEVLLKNRKNKKMQSTRSFYSYPGIKEDVYVPDYIPNNEILGLLGIDNGNIVVTIRPPATEAHYHRPESSRLFDAIMGFLLKNDNVRIIMLPRTRRQKYSIKNKWQQYIDSNKLIIPVQAVNGLDLIWYSDMVFSGGGTMIREAAALNVPAYSFFKGEIGAVDRFLAASGRLIMIDDLDDITSKIICKKRYRAEIASCHNHSALNSIIGYVEKALNP